MSKEKIVIAAAMIVGIASIAYSTYIAIRSIDRMRKIADKTNYEMAITALQEVRRTNEHDPEAVKECDAKIAELSAKSVAL